MKIELELHDARKELPTESKRYLVIMRSGDFISDMPYSAKHKLFNVYDDVSNKGAISTAIYVDWWAEIPEEMLSFPARDTTYDADSEKVNKRFEIENSWRKEL